MTNDQKATADSLVQQAIAELAVKHGVAASDAREQIQAAAERFSSDDPAVYEQIRIDARRDRRGAAPDYRERLGVPKD